VDGSFSLLGALKQKVPRRTARNSGSLFTAELCLLCEALFERFHLFETTPLLHGAAPCSSGAGAQPAFSSPVKATIRAVMLKGALERFKARVFFSDR
jgi:hypothetical protein